MININSTEQERYEALKNRKLAVVEWDNTKELQITNPEESISKALKRYVKELNLIGSSVNLEGIEEPVLVTMNTIKESIASMTKQHADLFNLSKLFTVINKVCQNAILVEVENFRHTSNKNKKAQIVENEFQYLSAFKDKYYIYPVKITAERRKQHTNTNVYVTLTIGNIPLNIILKEEFSIHGMHLSFDDRESLGSGSNSSFSIMLSHLIKYFNSEQAVLIKNLPNFLLTTEQQDIKQKLIKFDNNKEMLKRLNSYQIEIANAAERGEQLIYKVVPSEYSEKMRQKMIDSQLCFVPLTDDNGYLNIIVKEKDESEFLQIQSQVFQKEVAYINHPTEEDLKYAISNTNFLEYENEIEF